jgi:hypothetical protein
MAGKQARLVRCRSQNRGEPATRFWIDGSPVELAGQIIPGERLWKMGVERRRQRLGSRQSRQRHAVLAPPGFGAPALGLLAHIAPSILFRLIYNGVSLSQEI